MVPDPVLEISGLDITYSFTGKRFSGGGIRNEEDEDGEDKEKKDGEEEEKKVESNDDMATVESSDKA